MGIYLNPGNEVFRQISKADIYVDKTMMIRETNRLLDSSGKYICMSRPRRFGKSFAAQMLCAYYDSSCDSRPLFDNMEIAGKQGYLEHLNQYHVVSLDITAFPTHSVQFKK